MEKRKKIILSGGGTGGSVTPLLAVAQELLKDRETVELVFVGSKNGPEKKIVGHFASKIGDLRFIPFIAGKWRRYLSWKNFGDIFIIIIAFFKSFGLLKQEKPDLIISAGSFVSVPLVWAAAFKKIPVVIHQQDARPGLANKLMAPWARVITVNFEKSLIDYGLRAVWVGNPLIMVELDSPEATRRFVLEKYQLDERRPIILLIGGSLGAQALNNLLWSARFALSDYQIIHLSGAGKSLAQEREANLSYYQIFESLPHEEILKLISTATLVISRAGLGVLTELSLLNKPAIIIPIPNSHQEDNAAVFARIGAAIVLDQKKVTSDVLVATIKRVLNSPSERTMLANRISHVIKRGAAERLAGIIWEILEIK